MSQPAISFNRAERKRVLQAVPFEESTTLSRDLPLDTCVKSIQITISGSVVTTFASGTPVADSLAAMDNLISSIQVQLDGGFTVKSVRPWLMHIQELFKTGNIGTRRASAAAAAATDNMPTADAGFPYGTTTQVTTIREGINLDFEHPYALIGKESTWLMLKGRSSAEIKFVTRGLSSLLGFGNTAPVVYSSENFTIDIQLTEAKHIPYNYEFSYFKQTTKEYTYSAQQDDAAIELPIGNFISGLMIFAREGQAGSATTATGKLPSNLLLTKLNLKLNGQEDIQTTTFRALQDLNRQEFGVQAPFASNVSRLDGIAYMNLLNHRDLDTALAVMRPDVNQAQLVLSTNSSSNASYTNPASVTVMAEEIIRPRG